MSAILGGNWCFAIQDTLQRRPINRPRDIVALNLVAPHLFEKHLLLHGLDAFRHHPKAQVMGRLNDCFYHRSIGQIGGHVIDEALFDFQGINGQLTDVAERGVAGAKVVDVDLVVGIPHFGQKTGRAADQALGLG